MSYFYRIAIRKYNHEHDEKGRFSFGENGGLVSRMVSNLSNSDGQIEGNKGFTIDGLSNADVTTGYAVDAFPTRSLAIDSKGVTKAELTSQIEEWLKKNESLLSDKRVKIGGWVDPETHKIWLGATRLYSEDEKELAISMGKKHNQVSIAHLSAIAKGDWDHAFIPTGGDGSAPVQKDDSSQKVLVIMDGDASADSIADALLSHLK
jgi:hypothetical protein